MRSKHILLAILATLTLSAPNCWPQSAQSKTKQVQEFYDNNSFGTPARLPENVLRALVSSGMAGYARDWATDHPGGDLNRFFRAVQVELSDSKEPDYIVEGQFPLTGADCDWFWVVHSQRGLAEVVLFDNTDSIQLLKSRTNGLKDIQTIWQAPREIDRKIFRFSGERYRLVSKKWEERSGR